MSFLRRIVSGEIRQAYADYVDPGMRHHNAGFPGDAASLMQAMEADHVHHPHKVLEIRHILEDGNLVAIYSHVRMTPEDRGYAILHIYRFASDRIVELWDINQPVPESSPNDDGMF